MKKPIVWNFTPKGFVPEDQELAENHKGSGFCVFCNKWLGELGEEQHNPGDGRMDAFPIVQAGPGTQETNVDCSYWSCEKCYKTAQRKYEGDDGIPFENWDHSPYKGPYHG
jgi:hypothetical protein